MDVVGGNMKVHPISFGVGKGRLISNMDLTPQSAKNVHARMDLKMQNLDVSRMMAATADVSGCRIDQRRRGDRRHGQFGGFLVGERQRSDQNGDGGR